MRGCGSKWIRPSTRLAIYARSAALLRALEDGGPATAIPARVLQLYALGARGFLDAAPFRCLLCRRRAPWRTGPLRRRLTLDHWIPSEEGGTNEPSNLIAACWRCNTGRVGNGWALSGDGQLPALTRVRLDVALPLDRALGRGLVEELRPGWLAREREKARTRRRTRGGADPFDFPFGFLAVQP
jgi:5-methylcytosine-specific restriction endonuclease McrA